MENKTYAPVLITTLNRFEHFKLCLESLEKCVGADKTDVYVALDYPPSFKYFEGREKIDLFLAEKERNNHFGRLIVIRRNKNCGIKGENRNSNLLVGDIIEKYKTFIESEDDNIFSPNFLEYMNLCFEKYKDDADVVAITGYCHPIDWLTSAGASLQKQNFNASAWGCGWWTEKRKIVEQNIASGDMYNKCREVLKNGNYKKGLFVAFYEYVCASIIPIEFYRKIQSGRLCLTDYCMRQYLFVYDKKVVSPLTSLVRNIGLDGSGAYCQNNNLSDGSGTTSWNTDFAHQPIDESTTFEIVENDPALLSANRDLLDKYEWRPMKQHIIANLIAFGIRVFGLNFMRKFTSVVFKYWHRKVN